MWHSNQTPPPIVKASLGLTYGRQSEEVLVQVQSVGLEEGSYPAVAHYLEIDYGNGEKSYSWSIKNHTGNWDNRVLGWMEIPPFQKG